MTRLRIALATLLLVAPVTSAAEQLLQPPTPQQPPVVTTPPSGQDVPPVAEPTGDFDDIFRTSRSAIRIGQDFTLARGDAVRDAVVVFGSATIEGEVQDNLVVILGSVRLASTAVIRGDFTAVGGEVTAEPGVTVLRDFAVIGGAFNAPPGFTTGGEQVVIGGGMLGPWLRDLVPYLTRGLLWGRLIVPDLPWVWGIVGLFLLIYLALNLLFETPVRACATTLSEKPLTSFGVGLLVLLLVGPVCLLLAVSVIGVAIIPFVFFAIFGGWIIGKVAVARWIGMSIMSEEFDNRAHAARSVLVGFVLISIAYLIPIIGIAAWAIIGVLGLGAAAIAFVAAYRRENPKPVQPVVPVDVPPPPPVPATYSGTDATESAQPPTPAPSASFGGTEAAPAMAYQTMATPGATAAAVPLTVAHPAVLASMPKALFRDRLAAFVLDLIVVLITVTVLNVDGEDMFLPLLLVYHIGFWTWKQTTVGGIVCQLRVVRTDGAPLSFADALVRGLAGMFSLAVLFIGALWMLRDPESQTWHDKIAGTYVVKVPRQWPL